MTVDGNSALILVAAIGGLSGVIISLIGAVGAILSLRQSAANAIALEAAKGKAETAVDVAVEAQKVVTELKISVNHRMDQLISSVEAKSRAEGKEEGRTDEVARHANPSPMNTGEGS